MPECRLLRFRMPISPQSLRSSVPGWEPVPLSRPRGLEMQIGAGVCLKGRVDVWPVTVSDNMAPAWRLIFAHGRRFISLAHRSDQCDAADQPANPCSDKRRPDYFGPSLERRHIYCSAD